MQNQQDPYYNAALEVLGRGSDVHRLTIINGMEDAVLGASGLLDSDRRCKILLARYLELLRRKRIQKKESLEDAEKMTAVQLRLYLGNAVDGRVYNTWNGIINKFETDHGLSSSRKESGYS